MSRLAPQELEQTLKPCSQWISLQSASIPCHRDWKRDSLSCVKQNLSPFKSNTIPWVYHNTLKWRKGRAFVNSLFWQAVSGQLGGSVEWQTGARAVLDCGMGWRNWRKVPLEFGCTIRSIEEPWMKDYPPVVVWVAHGAGDKPRPGFESWRGISWCRETMGDKIQC